MLAALSLTAAGRVTMVASHGSGPKIATTDPSTGHYIFWWMIHKRPGR